MHTYVNKLKNFPENPFMKDFSYGNSVYELQPINALNNSVVEILNKLNLSTDKISIFRSTDYCEHTIHRDNDMLSDVAKIIWMWGDDHEMFWYKVKDDAKNIYGKKKGPDGVYSSYISYDKNDVTLMHREKITGPSLIQVGCPHNVINYSGNRISFTVVPCLVSNKKLLRPITYGEALHFFNEYLQ